jgi:hypothetical protein
MLPYLHSQPERQSGQCCRYLFAAGVPPKTRIMKVNRPRFLIEDYLNLNIASKADWISNQSPGDVIVR